jgi:hypothetical protein
MQLLKLSTAATVVVGPVLDADGAAVTTATVTDFSIAKNGTVAALTTETVTHSVNGYYTIALTTDNTDTLGRLDVITNDPAMSMTNHRYTILPADTYEELLATGIADAVLGNNAPANWINAASIAASALNGKGDWNIGKTGYALSSSQTFSLTGNITGNLSGSVGSVTSPVTAGTVSDKTGYSLAVAPPTTAQIADAVWDEDNRGHTSPHSTGKNLDTIRKANYVIDGTVAAGGTPTTTVFRTTLTQLDSTYDHQTLLFLTGNLGGQSKPILSYSQADGVITLDEALTEVPIAGDEFVILPHHVHPLSIIISRILAAEIESGGYDLKRTLQAVGAMLAGLVSGAGSGTESFKAIGTPAKTRVQFVVDANGNRTGVTYDWS